MKSKRFLGNLLIFVITFLILLCLVEAILGLIENFSKKASQETITYPPNYSEKASFLEGSYNFRSNNKGIRYRQISDKKESSTQLRFVVLGDSFVEGEGVEQNDLFTEILERRFSTPNQNTLFINCGISGAGPVEYEKILNQVGFSYYPDKVLIVLYANDLESMPLPKPALDQDRCPTPPSNYSPNTFHRIVFYCFFPRIYQALREVYSYKQLYIHKENRLADSILEIFLSARRLEISNKKISQWIHQIHQSLPKDSPQDWVKANKQATELLELDYFSQSLDLDSKEAKFRWHLMDSTLDRMVESCRQKNIDVFLVYAPCPYQYDPYYKRLPKELWAKAGKDWLSGESEFEKTIKNWSDSRQVPFLNLTPYLKEEAKKPNTILNFRNDQHWNPLGHQVVAGVIGRWLEDLYPRSGIRSQK